MKTNFFELLKKTNIKQVDLSIVFNDDNTVSVVCISKPQSSKDSAVTSLKPIIFTNSVEQSDEHFFVTISSELSKRQAFYTNVETLEKDREEKQKQTAFAKEKKENAKKKLEQLEKLFKDETFDVNQPEKKQKADKLIAESLQLNPNCKKTIEIRKKIQELTTQEELF